MQVDTFADGVAVKMVGEEPFRICRTLIDEVVFHKRPYVGVSQTRSWSR